MTPADLPAPLVPPEVDLNGLEYMPLLGDRLFSSDFDLDASDTEFRIGLKLWWAAWKQVPAASLPKEDARLCKLAGLGENPAKWRKVRERALHGFVECSDGRLYHPVVAKQALIAWEKRVEDKAERDGDAERKKREREERSAMFADLKARGITPKWNITTTELRKLHAAPVTVTSPPPVTGQVTEPVTVTVTAKTGRDGTGRDVIPPGTEDGGTPSPVSAPLPSAPSAHSADDDAPPPSPGEVPALGAPISAGGAVCLAIRRAGVQDVNPSHPDLLRLIAAGATPQEFADVAEAAVRGKKARFAYVLATVEGRRRDAANAAPVPSASPAPLTKPDRIAQHNADVVRRFAERNPT